LGTLGDGAPWRTYKAEWNDYIIRCEGNSAHYSSASNRGAIDNDAQPSTDAKPNLPAAAWKNFVLDSCRTPMWSRIMAFGSELNK
jgi:hypothetical protein